MSGGHPHSPPRVLSPGVCALNQADDGHWPGDYGGPMFLMPGMLIALYTTGKLSAVLSPQHRHEMVRYLVNHQNSDGGYGLHIEGGSTMFGTALKCGSSHVGTPGMAPLGGFWTACSSALCITVGILMWVHSTSQHFPCTADWSVALLQSILY